MKKIKDSCFFISLSNTIKIVSVAKKGDWAVQSEI